jgi:UDP-2,4-diacetamido-2,4,6-trideoxy-beta-L-altropyranose hydrolase
MSLGKILIRADASVEIGTGHVMRCLALAQAWQDAGGEAVFAMAESTPAVDQKLQAQGFEIARVGADPGSAEDAENLVALGQRWQPQWLILDSYRFGRQYQRAVRSFPFKLLLVDDMGGCERYDADIVLNQNLHAAAEMYSHRAPRTRLLLGTGYAMLRREFVAAREWHRKVPTLARKVLVTTGGSDPLNLASRIVQAVELLSHELLEVRVVVGGSSPHFQSVEACAMRSGKNIRLEVNPGDMSNLMMWADVAVSAAGSTCWEICMLGLSAIVIETAENQRPLAVELSRRNIASHLPLESASSEGIAHSLDSLIRSKERRAQMSRNGRQLVDGLGAGRVVSAMRAPEINLRRITHDDCHLLWEWANDADVRQASFSPDPIPWETHVAWFAERVRDNQSLIFIAEDREGRPFGQIRFDIRPDGDCEVDVSVAKFMRGRGFASELIARAVQNAFRERRCARVHARVKPANVASLKAFEKADFKRIDDWGSAPIHLIREGN